MISLLLWLICGLLNLIHFMAMELPRRTTPITVKDFYWFTGISLMGGPIITVVFLLFDWVESRRG